MADDIFTPSRLYDRLDQMDQAINVWRKVGYKKLLQSLLSLGVEDKIKLTKQVQRIKFKKSAGGNTRVEKDQFLSKSLGSHIRKKQGDIEAVAYSFARTGIFIQHGVGKGRPKGSAKARSAAKPWITNVLPAHIEDLAELLTNEYADIAAAELHFNIPGIMSSKVTK